MSRISSSVPCCNIILTAPGKPLEFFSTKLSTAERKYSAFDRELLAMYRAVRHFRHMVETREFCIYTDYKPVTFAYNLKSTKLEYISQFTTDLRHVAGTDNVVADALSRVEEMESSMDYQALAVAQEQDQELRECRQSTSSLQLKEMLIPVTCRHQQLDRSSHDKIS